MTSRLIELVRALAAVGPRVRFALSERVLDAVFRRVVAAGDEPAMPLAPDPGAATYWTKREDRIQVPGRYEKQY